MPFIPIIIIILVVVLILVLATNLKVVQQSKAYVIERLGAFHSVWGVGIHFKVPFLERVAKVVSLKEQVVDFPPQPVITKDNVTMQIDTVLYFQITDPKLYAYGVERPMSAIENLSVTTMRNIIGDMDLEQTLTSRDTINSQMRALLDEGVLLLRDALVCSAGTLRESDPRRREAAERAARALSPRQLTQAVGVLERLRAACGSNVGAGHLAGWLAAALSTL